MSTFKSRIVVGVVVGGVFQIWGGSRAQAYVLPYSTRSMDYSAWSPATQGDTSTIGMAGATIALPTSVSAAYLNPSGFSMLTGTVSAQINKTTFNDQRIQLSGDTIQSQQWGFGVNPDRWGFSIGYYSPQTESGTYVSPNTGDTADVEVSMKELQFTVSRAFFDSTVALGVTIEGLKGVREINGTSSSSYGISYALSSLVRLPRHILFAATFFPQAQVGPASNPDGQSVLPGFNQSVIRPSQLSFGLGWMPNRFFKVGSSLTWVGPTVNTSLFANQSIIEGASATYVPRVGAAYVFGEFSNFKLELALGSYYEVSRISGYSDRIHATAGIDANPYFINAGAGFDVSTDYRNFIVSVGVDIVRTARAFDIIPPEPVPPLKKFFPPITDIIPDGLPDGLTVDEVKQFKGPSVTNVAEIVKDVPGNIVKKVEGKPTSVEVKQKVDSKKKNHRNVKSEVINLSPSN